jgi:outer membrane receptor for ferrienterochelin and colicin
MGLRQLKSYLLCPTILVSATSVCGTEDIMQVYGDEDMISLATGYRQPVAKAPAVATVITAEEIEAIGARTLEQVLETVPGLHISTARSISDVYVVRGIFSENNAQVLVMINNIPVSDVVNGGRPQTWKMPVFNIERIEIVRGPGSAIYGADAFAGVINVITKTAKNIDGTQLGAEAGSFDTYGGWFLHGGEMGPVDVAVALQGSTTDGYGDTITADDQTRIDNILGTSASLAPRPINTRRDDINARIDLSYDNWRLHTGYQGFFNVGTGVGTVLALDPQGKVDTQLINADLTYNLAVRDDLELDAQASFFRYDFDSSLKTLPNGAFDGAFPDGVLNDVKFIADHVRTGVTALYSGLRHHQLRLGVGFNYSTVGDIREKRNFLLSPTGLPIPTGVFADTDTLGVEGSAQPFDRRVYYGLIQDEWQFARDWTLTAGLRVDSFSDFGSTVNPRASLVWSASPSLTAKLLYGRAFRAPSLLELIAREGGVARGNPNLDPETINMVELALLKQWNQDLYTGLNVFWYETDDLIQAVTASATQPSIVMFENTAGTWGSGMEFDGRYDITRHLHLKFNYAFQHSEDSATNTSTGIVPKHQVYAQAGWQFIPRWHLDGRLKWVGGRDRQEGDPRGDIDDYVLVGITIRRTDIVNHLDFSISINNLFNTDAREPSLAPLSIPGDIPLPDRNVIAILCYRL